jgi:hypothetical protein
MQVEHRLALGFIAGVQETAGLGLVLGAETGLLAGRAVLGVEYLTAPEQGVFVFHGAWG